MAGVIVALQRQLAVSPGDPAAWHRLAALYYRAAQYPPAAVLFARAARISPAADCFGDLGLALQRLDAATSALPAFAVAVCLAPDRAAAYFNLGTLWQDAHQADAAQAAYGRGLRLSPADPRLHNNLAILLHRQGDLTGAADHCRQAIAAQPDHPNPLINLGHVRRDQGRVSAAGHCYRTALLLNPDRPEPYNDLATCLVDHGQVRAALPLFRRTLAIDRSLRKAEDNLLTALHYLPESSPADMLRQAKAYAVSLEAGPPCRIIQRAPRQVLRIGYVSGDFRAHPVGYFLARVLPAHDPAQVEVFCYSNSHRSDSLTASLRQSAACWRDITDLADDAATALIQADGIDILVDLAGHTADNRLALFARKPAPLQVSWLGYFGSTGLSRIDYVLCDQVVVRPGEQAWFSERPFRLPGCYLCYAPHRLDILPGPFPALASGQVTFGCFNNLAKINEDVVAAWSAILRQTPASRLWLKSKGLGDPEAGDRLRRAFAAQGIAAERLLFEGHTPLADALAAYNRVDIALDPFPFGGCTTTAETLWMGVPLVTLCGDRWAGRMSTSILTSLGLSDWVALDREQYIALAVARAADLSALAGLRYDLRARLENAPLCDGAAFTRGLEAAFRAMWEAR